MFELFEMGGPLFMGIQTVVLAIIILIAVYNLILIVSDDYKNLELSKRRLAYIKGFGLFAMITGILGQLLGLYSAFSAIERAKDVSPAIMMGGLKVSLITPIYGMIIFLISYLLWIGLDYLASRDRK